MSVISDKAQQETAREKKQRQEQDEEKDEEARLQVPKPNQF